MLEGWQVSAMDVPRARRLAAGTCVGLALLAALGFAATRVKAAPAPAPAEPEEEDIPVALVETPEEAPPPPEEPAAPTEKITPGPRRSPPPSSPTTIPDGAKQTDVGEDPYGNAPPPEAGNGGGGGSGSGSGPAAPLPTAPPPPKPPPAPAPRAAPAPDDYEPPKCKLASPDRAQAKAIGVEGTVVVKYTVTESGAIVNARVTKGPPELGGLALAAIAASRCEPARMKSDGAPVSVTRTVRYPIRFTAN